MNKLYRFSYDCGRMGNLDGTFVADDEKIDEAEGELAYFGEVLGKHSDISVKLKAKTMLTVLTDDQTFIQKFVELGCESGFNPLDYINQD